MGILSSIKHLGPLLIYVIGILFFLRGMTGDGRWALLLVTLIIPLRNIVDKVQEFPLGSQFIDILIFGALIGSFIFCSKEKRQFMVPSILNPIIVILVLYTFFSLFLGSNYLHGTFSISFADDRVKDWKNFCLMPLLFFITLNHITDRAWIVRMLLGMLAATVLMEYYTVSQIHEYSSLISREKITGTFQFLGPNEVAAFFNEYTMFIMGIFFCLKQKKYKWPLLIIIYLNLFCIIFLYSRGSYLGALAGMAFLFLIKNKKLLIPLILVLCFWQSVLPEKAVQRIKGTTNEYGQLDESSERRLSIWKIGMDLFQKNPVTGIGYGVFRSLGLDLGDTHNIYVKILVEQGIIGMLIFLVIIFSFLRMGYVLYKKGEDDLGKGMGLGMMACVITVIINNFFGDRWAYFELSAYFWIFAGLVARFIIMNKNSTSVGPPQVNTKANSIAPGSPKKKLRYYDL